MLQKTCHLLAIALRYIVIYVSFRAVTKEVQLGAMPCVNSVCPPPSKTNPLLSLHYAKIAHPKIYCTFHNIRNYLQT